MKIPDLSKTFFCNYCERKTSHSPLSHGSLKSLQATGLSGRNTFEVMECRDCGNTIYCIHHWLHPGSMVGDPYIKCTEYFPPLSFRPKPKWYSELSRSFRTILDEVYLALDNHLFILASTGTRTALDLLIFSKVGDVGRFEDKADLLLKNGIINSQEKDLLLAVIDAGSASAHRNFKPNKKAINDMMEITEHIFYKFCIESGDRESLFKKAKELINRTPKRR
jgi:hypothetical protein